MTLQIVVFFAILMLVVIWGYVLSTREVSVATLLYFGRNVVQNGGEGVYARSLS